MISHTAHSIVAASIAQVVGDIVLCLAILGGCIVFVIANVNYLPDDEDK